MNTHRELVKIVAFKLPTAEAEIEREMKKTPIGPINLREKVYEDNDKQEFMKRDFFAIRLLIVTRAIAGEFKISAGVNVRK